MLRKDAMNLPYNSNPEMNCADHVDEVMHSEVLVRSITSFHQVFQGIVHHHRGNRAGNIFLALKSPENIRYWICFFQSLYVVAGYSQCKEESFWLRSQNLHLGNWDGRS